MNSFSNRKHEMKVSGVIMILSAVSAAIFIIGESISCLMGGCLAKSSFPAVVISLLVFIVLMYGCYIGLSFGIEVYRGGKSDSEN